MDWRRARQESAGPGAVPQTAFRAAAGDRSSVA